MTEPSSPVTNPDRRVRLDWVLLAGLIAITALAVGGFGYYALRPENLPQDERVLRFYAMSFEFFGKTHIIAAGVVLFAVLLRAVGARWIVPFLATGAIAFTAEHVGTGYGFPFGDYSYTALLGPRIGERVPFVIPVSWFLVALPSFFIAARLTPNRGPWARIVFGALFLTAWDLALDPAMSFLTPYWLWGIEGAYYGMPAVNLLGWVVTGLAIMAGLEALRVQNWLERLPANWMYAYYAVMVALPVGMIAAAGLWLGVAVTLVGVALCIGGAVLANRPGTSTELVESPA